jgi:hypothetical protein
MSTDDVTSLILPEWQLPRTLFDCEWQICAVWVNTSGSEEHVHALLQGQTESAVFMRLRASARGGNVTMYPGADDRMVGYLIQRARQEHDVFVRILFAEFLCEYFPARCREPYPPPEEVANITSHGKTGVGGKAGYWRPDTHYVYSKPWRDAARTLVVLAKGATTTTTTVELRLL